ncbi:hypothetical protein AB2E84_26350 (plasmid) [Escherichia coli]
MKQLNAGEALNDFGLHAENLSTLPAVRLKNLARYAGMTSVFNIAGMSPQKRMAVLVAFVLAWETLALDDALDVLDAMLVRLSSVTPERLGRKNGSAR